jgi:hypothetical protein
MIRISFGNNNETHAGYGGTVIMDPVREQRLQRAFMPQFNKPGSALPVLREDWGHTIFYSYVLKTGACENAGDFSVAERIDRAYSDKKPVTDIPLRRNCPELQ